MGGTYSVTVGDKGRIVVPAELREQRQWHPGTQLIALEGVDGVVLMERDHLLRRVRDQLEGSDLVASLLEERRRAAALENEG